MQKLLDGLRVLSDGIYSLTLGFFFFFRMKLLAKHHFIAQCPSPSTSTSKLITLRLCLVRVKLFPENILFSGNAIFRKGKRFHVFGCHKIHFTEN